jgi:hypothetical protein
LIPSSRDTQAFKKERKIYEEILEEMINGNENAEGKQLEGRPIEDGAAE